MTDRGLVSVEHAALLHDGESLADQGEPGRELGGRVAAWIKSVPER
jgi:hypothetical protein